MEKIALVTGGSSGIGRAVTAALAERGDTVLFTYRVPHGAVLTTEKVRDSGWEVRPVFCELTDYAATRGLVRQIIEEFGRIDILVNNAGISNTKKLEEIDEAEWDHMMDTNLKGTFFLTQAVFQEMKRNGYGRIVSIASVAGEQGGLYSGMHYSISKGGILTMSRCFAREGAPYGRQLMQLAEERGKTYWIFMGGKLNAILPGDSEPTEIAHLLEEIGIHAENDIAQTVVQIAAQ